MNELQGAIADVRDLCDGSEPDSLHVLVEAARRVANPDYEAAAKRRYEDVKRKAEQNGLIGFIDWDDLEDDERQEDWVDEMRSYVDAALGIPEDD